jgi:hypothetical protein
MELFSLVVLVSLLAFGSADAQANKDKVSLNHKGHVITVAPEAVPAHLAHGDSYVVSNNFSVTITIINNGGSGTVDGPTLVASGASATYYIVPDAASFSSFVLVVDGVPVYGDNVPYFFTLVNVTAPRTIEVTFSSLL